MKNDNDHYGKTVRITPPGKMAFPPFAEGRVTGTGNGLLQIEVPEASVWLRRKLQSRGIFIGKKSSWTMQFFKAHDGQWICTQSMEPFDIVGL
jgi:hypothetical protein